jgi:hypothetical protein
MINRTTNRNCVKLALAFKRANQKRVIDTSTIFISNAIVVTLARGSVPLSSLYLYGIKLSDMNVNWVRVHYHSIVLLNVLGLINWCSPLSPRWVLHKTCIISNLNHSAGTNSHKPTVTTKWGLLHVCQKINRNITICLVLQVNFTVFQNFTVCVPLMWR